jgi:dihydrolipoamide dehydrogenase
MEVPADKVLLSIGRRAFTDGLGLENIGVETERGKIKTDDKGCTNIAGVYATGDVNGYSMLAHTAYRETEVAINNILGKKDTMRYTAIPSVIYTNPEVASVGETEETAKAKGIDFEVAKLSMMYSGRYVAENEGGDGIIKVLIDKKYRNVIGVHMIGYHSSEIIYGAGVMIETEMRVEDIKKLVFPHPSVCEVIREAIFEFDD